MTKLQQLHVDQGQSPWVDHLTRGHLTGGELRRLVEVIEVLRPRTAGTAVGD